ncbi:MAG: LysM peptidoglycan-binding domain-containing protein [Flavobacteriales bacterium]
MQRFYFFLLSFLLSMGAWSQYAYESTGVELEPIEKPLLIHQFRFHKILQDTIQLEANDLLVCDSFCAQGMPSTYDALHSFNYRIADRFGGYLNIKVNLALEQIRQNGFPSDVKKIYIQIDPIYLKVYWFVVVGPSIDGTSYVRIDSRGSAGGGVNAVQKQLPYMLKKHPNFQAHKLMEFNENVPVCYDWSGNQLCDFNGTINIRQHFYKFSAPEGMEIPPVEDTELITNPILFDRRTANEETTPTNYITHKTSKPSVKTYRVKSGDTLSEIAKKNHVSIASIKKVNQLRSDQIQIGQTLKIPK